ncbi:Extracellular metalloproteinase 4 [Microsporum ferrugineum]
MHGLLLAGLLALPSNVLGHPAEPPSSVNVTHRHIDTSAYFLPQLSLYNKSEDVAEYGGDNITGSGYSGGDYSASNLSSEDYVTVATSLLKATLPYASFRLIDDHYIGDSGIGHVHFRQTVYGIDIDNTDFNVNVGRDGKVFSYGSSFYKGEIPKANPVAKRDFSDPVNALIGAINTLKIPVTAAVGEVKTTPIEGNSTYMFKGTTGALTDPTAQLVYLQKDGGLHLTWRVETDVGDNWLLTYVDANKNDQIHGVVDYVASAEYQVYPWGVNDPTDGERAHLYFPWFKTGSRNWHIDGRGWHTTTRGNNAIAQDNPSGGWEYEDNHRPTNPLLIFRYPYTQSMTPPASYRDASITQLFYTGNVYHDLLYILGFNEKAGNFQVNNWGKGGKGNDFTILNTQDGSGVNNANFATPPDGQPGRMRMYVWDTSTPYRDGSFEAGIVIHEYTHGVSNRLTGGPANSRCLSSLESGGMGEGWSDFFATVVHLKERDTRNKNYTIGAWASGRQGGIRKYPYSTDLHTNPLMYVDADGLESVHAIGTIWCTILNEVLWNLIERHGMGNVNKIKPTFKDGVPTDGRNLAMKLVLDGMALQPCLPNFVQARDAIIDADMNLTKGANRCELWKAFAKRGLGVGAAYNPEKRVGSSRVPGGC